MALKAEVSLATGLATAVIVWAIHQHAVPTMAEVRVGPKHDEDVESARRLATWTSAGVVAAISLIAKDATVFVIGGAMAVGLDWWTRYSNETDPETGRATSFPQGIPTMGVTDPPAYDAQTQG